MCLTVEVCCFCIDLEAGSKIVAICNLVLSAFIAITYGCTASSLTYLPPSRRIFYGLVCAASIGQIVLGLLMTYGTFRKRPKILWIWVRVAWMSSVILVGMAVFGIVVITMDINGTDSSEVSTMASAYLLYGVSMYYSASVVNSRRLEIELEENKEAASMMIRQLNTPKSLLTFEDV